MNYVWRTVLSSPLTWGLVMVYLENTFFLSSKTLSWLPVMYITFWFNAFSIMSDFFFFCTTFIERIWGLEKEIFSPCISPGDLKEGNFSFFFFGPCSRAMPWNMHVLFQENPVLWEMETVLLYCSVAGPGTSSLWQMERQPFQIFPGGPSTVCFQKFSARLSFQIHKSYQPASNNCLIKSNHNVLLSGASPVAQW